MEDRSPRGGAAFPTPRAHIRGILASREHPSEHHPVSDRGGPPHRRTTPPRHTIPLHRATSSSGSQERRGADAAADASLRPRAAQARDTHRNGTGFDGWSLAQLPLRGSKPDAAAAIEIPGAGTIRPKPRARIGCPARAIRERTDPSPTARHSRSTGLAAGRGLFPGREPYPVHRSGGVEFKGRGQSRVRSDLHANSPANRGRGTDPATDRVHSARWPRWRPGERPTRGTQRNHAPRPAADAALSPGGAPEARSGSSRSPGRSGPRIATQSALAAPASYQRLRGLDLAADRSLGSTVDAESRGAPDG